MKNETRGNHPFFRVKCTSVWKKIKIKIKKLFFFRNFRVYTLTDANAMLIVSRLQNKEQMVK